MNLQVEIYVFYGLFYCSPSQIFMIEYLFYMFLIQPQYLSLSTFISTPFFHTFFWLYQPYLLAYSTEVSAFFISSFISLYLLYTLCTETNLSWLIYESIKALDTSTSIAFNLAFSSITFLSCFFLFFLIIDLYFLIPAIITQIFIIAAELAILIGIFF